jgi:C4-type Zn-finger protein
MSNYENQEFKDFCPVCDGHLDYLDRFYDYEHEMVVEVWFCFYCSLSIKVSPEDSIILETMENDSMENDS